MVSEWSSSILLPRSRKENKTKRTKRTRLSLSHRQKWGQMGPPQSMLSYRLNALSCMWTSTRSLTSLPDGLCALCVQTALSWRSFTGVLVAVGWEKAGKVRQTGHEEQEKQDAENWRRRKDEVGAYGCRCTFQTTWTTWNRELLSLSLTTNSSISAKNNLWGNSIIFSKDSTIYISHLHFMTYLHTNPT